MQPYLEDISQITIYLKKGSDSEERVNEVALYQPLEKRSRFIDDEKMVHKLKSWHFTKSLPLQQKVLLRIQSFFFHHFPKMVSQERKNPEAQVKTVLAILLSQETLAEFFLQEHAQRHNFLQAIKSVAHAFGYIDFVLPPSDLTPKELCDALTTLSGERMSLLEDRVEFTRALTWLPRETRDTLLFQILDKIERPPLTSILEVTQKEQQIKKIAVITRYGKYRIEKIDPETGKISLSYKEDQAQTAFRLKETTGAINQHLVVDETLATPTLLGGYAGELTTYYHVLEQILFLLNIRGECFLESVTPKAVEKTLLFTSLFSWNEYEKICEEHNAIEKLHGKILRFVSPTGETHAFRLNLLHQNISFNAFNKFPAPAEMQATLNDQNDKTLLVLASKLLAKADFPALHTLAAQYTLARSEADFFKKERMLLEIVDTFRQMKKQLTAKIEGHTDAHLIALRELLQNPRLHEVDTLIYTSLITRRLHIIHNKNSAHATDRAASALSLDKAQNAFCHTLKKPFLPGYSTHREEDLFKVFYSMYLVFEEPELNTGLTTGFVGEKFYSNFIQRNPEATRYLTSWLQEHPEIYLGLSSYRH